MTVREKIMEFRENGLTWTQIAEEIREDYPSLTQEQRYNKARNLYRGLSESEESCVSEEKNDTSDCVSNKTVEYKADGTTTFSGIVALMDGEPITPDAIMKAHNLDHKLWDVITYKTNFWESQKKRGTKLLLYQSKITVKPKKKNEITFEDIDNYFEGKDYSSIVIPTRPRNIGTDGETLEIDVADVHTGLLAHFSESGNNYDLKIAKKNFFDCIYDIEERCEHRKIKKIELVNLGDFLHCDDFNASQTTAGTRQDSDGRISKIVDYGESMLIGGIEILGNIAPLELLYIGGNHDSLTGFMLCRSVANAFRKDKNITFDVTPNPIKKRMFGKNLVLFHHGNMPKSNIDDLVYKHAREEFGLSNYSEIHMGHLHTEIVRPKCGTTIRNVTAITGSSYWENQQGYHTPMKAITSFVWNDEKGLRDIWYSNI